MKYQNKLNTSNLNNKKQALFKLLFGCENIGVLPVFTCKETTNNRSIHIKQRDDNYNGIPHRKKNMFFGIYPTEQKKLHY